MSEGKKRKQQLHTLPIDNVWSENVSLLTWCLVLIYNTYLQKRRLKLKPKKSTLKKQKQRRTGDKLKIISLLQIILIQGHGHL